MEKIEVPSHEQLSPKSQVLTAMLAKQFGKAPDLFSVIGLSENTLENYLNFRAGNAKGTFSAKEIEAVSLVVSQVAGSKYCQAGHTVFGKMHGLSEGETMEIRLGRHSNPKLQAIISMAIEIAQKHGNVSQQSLENFHKQGFATAALIDLSALVVDALLANYVCNTTQLDIDFPLAKQVGSQ